MHNCRLIESSLSTPVTLHADRWVSQIISLISIFALWYSLLSSTLSFNSYFWCLYNENWYLCLMSLFVLISQLLFFWVFSQEYTSDGWCLCDVEWHSVAIRSSSDSLMLVNWDIGRIEKKTFDHAVNSGSLKRFHDARRFLLPEISILSLGAPSCRIRA